MYEKEGEDHARTNDMEKHDQGCYPVNRLHPLIWTRARMENLGGDDRADPVSVQHDMDQDSEGE